MAKMRTTQEAFLNRYLNGYQNTQASTVSGGRKKSAAAASAGERIMNSTSKQIPKMTDYSASIYSGIASNAKQAISEAEKLAAAQQKAALQAQKQAQKQATSSVRRTTRRSTSSKQTSGTASEDLAAAAKAALGKKVNTTQAKPDVSAATAKAVELAKKVAQTANAAKKDTAKNTTQKKATNPGSTYLTGAENKTAALRTGRDDIPSYIAKSFGTGVGGGTADIGKNVANLISLGVRLGDKIPFPDGDNEVAQAQQKVYEQQRQSAIDALNRLSAQSPVSGTPTNPLKTDLSGLPDLAERDQSSLADLKAIAELPALDTLTEEDKQKLGLAGETFAGRPVTNPLQTDALDDMKHLADQDLPFLDKSLNELSQMDNDYQAEQDRHGIVRGAGEVSRFGGNAVPQIASYALMNGALGAAGANELTNAAGGAISGAAAKGATKLGLNGAAKTLASEAAAKHVGNILLGQAADTALDTLPSLGNDILDYQDQQAQINNGEQVENPLTPGKIAANTAANVGTNLAFNVLGEGADALKGKFFKKTPDAALKQAEIPSLSASDAVSEQSRQLTLPKETGLYTTNLPDISKSADEALQQAKIPSLDMADTISEQSRQFTLPKESEAYMPEMTKPGKDLNTAIPSLTEKVDVSAKPQTVGNVKQPDFSDFHKAYGFKDNITVISNPAVAGEDTAAKAQNVLNAMRNNIPNTVATDGKTTDLNKIIADAAELYSLRKSVGGDDSKLLREMDRTSDYAKDIAAFFETHDGDEKACTDFINSLYSAVGKANNHNQISIGGVANDTTQRDILSAAIESQRESAGQNVPDAGAFDNGGTYAGIEPSGATGGTTDVYGGQPNPAGNQGLFRQPVISPEQSQRIASAGATWDALKDTTSDPVGFSKALDEAREANQYGLMVSSKTPEELSAPGTITFMGSDGKSGAVVTADGDIEGVFKHPDSNAKRASTQLLITAVENGGNKLDCYGKGLVKNYEMHGFQPVAKVPFDPKQVPAGWSYGPQDVYVMKLADGVDADEIVSRVGLSEADGGFHVSSTQELDALPTYSDYDEALAYRDSLIPKNKANAQAPAEQAGAFALSEPLPEVSQSIPNSEQAPPSLFDEPPVGVGAMAAQNPIQFATNQDVATQHNMFDTLVDEDKVAMGAGQQTHQILTHGQGKKIGEDDFNALVQINNGDEKQAAQSLLDTLKGKTQLSAQENYDIMAAADVIGKNMQLADKDSAEHAILQAQQTRLYEKMSASLSESAQALNMAQKGEVSPIAKYYNLVDKITAKANPKEQKSAAEFAKDLSDMADTMGKDILADQPMNDEFEAFVKSQGIDTGSATGDKLEYVAKNVKETAVAHGTELNDEQAKQIAAKIVTGASSDEIKKEILKQAKGIHGLSDSEMQYVQYLADKIATLPDSKERYDCETEMYSALAKSLPAKSALDKLDNFRYLAMLGNTRTHARNIIGNVVMRAAVDAKDFVGAGLEHVFLPKDQRTRIAFARFTQNFRDMKRATADFMNSNVYSRVMTRDGKFNLQQGLEGQQTVFNTKWLEKVRKFFDNALSGEDDYFVKSEFVNSLAQNLTAKGYGSEIFTATDKTSKDVLEDAIQLALKDSDYATFHSDSVTAQGFSALSRHFRDKGGVGGIGGYVLVEGNLPFKKTPVNMFKDAIEFSGGGIAEGTYKLLSNLKTGKYTANEVIDDFAKGMTGAGVVAAGVGLGRAGLIHAGAVDNAAQDDFNTMQGKQHYSIEVPGGGTYTIDWAAPLIIPLLVGAEIGQYSADYGASLQELPEFIAAATSRLGQPLIEASFMQGIEDAFEAVSYAQSGDKVSSFISNSAQGYAQQFVPTVVGQIARSFDDTRRDNYGGGQTAFKRNLTYAQSKLENKLPGLSMTNEPYVDPWGNTQESLDGSGKLGAIGGFAARLGYNMLSPGYYSSNKTTETEQQLQSLYDATGNSSVFPSTSVNKVNLTGNSNYYMTPQEKTAYNTERGQQSKVLVDGALSNPMFATLSDSDKATAISDMYSLASDIAKAKVFPNEKIDNKLYNAYSTGGADGAMNYIAGNTSLAAARDDKDGTLTKQESWQAIRNMPSLDDSQKLQSYLANTTDSTTTQIYGQSGETAALAYLDAYDYAKGQSNTGSVSKTDVEDYLLSLPSLSADDFAGAYLGAYSESSDPKAHSAYNDLGADGLKNWIQYIGNADLNGNGSVSQKEAIAVLDEMNLTNEERAYYYALTNKSWGNKNHY